MNGKRAQVSVEFLLDFLLVLALISVLLGSLSHFLSSAKAHSEAVLEKARIEGVARSLDGLETAKGARIRVPGGYSMGDGGNGGVLVGGAGWETIYGYTIYGMGGGNGEPV